METRQREAARVEFVYQRGGTSAARDFCKQGLLVYSGALTTPYGKVFKQGLGQSIEYYRWWLGQVGYD